MKMKPEAMYATMNPWRLFFVIAIPGMVSMFAMSVYSILEGAFIGHKLGESAFAAVNIAFPLVMINFSIADLIGVGASVPISIALGKKNYDTANNVFSCSLVMILVASTLLGGTMFFAAEPLARMMGASDSLLETSVRYLRTYALCSPLTTVFFAVDNYLRISGYVKTSMVINIACNAITIGLLSLFLFVFDMDVVGSAIATCISFCLCSLAALSPFLMKKTLLKFQRPKFSKNIFKEIMSDLGKPLPPNGDLTRWARQGVLLLNATLTVQAHQAGSHQRRGWETFTDAAIRCLAEEREHLVFILWGAYAQKKGAFIDRNKHLVLTSAHPSPLSAYNGFFGNKHFSRTNEYLAAHGIAGIEW